MPQPPPAAPGMPEDEIDTPALLLDLDAFEFNLDRMAACLAPPGTKLRAHAKAQGWRIRDYRTGRKAARLGVFTAAVARAFRWRPPCTDSPRTEQRSTGCTTVA